MCGDAVELGASGLAKCVDLTNPPTNSLFTCCVFADSTVNIHDLGSFSLRSSLQKTKGLANLFAIDPPPELSQRYKMCVSTKKKLVIYEWQMGEFIETKVPSFVSGFHCFRIPLTRSCFSFAQELGIPDKARSLVWCDEKICAGFTREYSLIHTGTGAINELFPISRASPLSILLPNKEMLLAKDSEHPNALSPVPPSFF